MRGTKDAATRFRETVLPYLDDAYTLARYLTRSAADADDLVQEAFARALRYFDGFSGGDPRPWLLAILRNCFYAWLRARRAQQGEPLPDPEEAAAEATADPWGQTPEDPEAALIRIDEAAVVRALVEALPEPFREVLVLREMNDLSYQQIAEVTEVPIGTVMSRLARARLLVKRAWLARQGEEAR
ncbi:sigma-70 family RNA polymerase sigma factor [Inquilinus limosus]|uniref:RNA polymerase sigma factor n=1 Tax=Inquilinus limosus MP06 TaxID=1398085 RepID=A0A0A0DF97_9PROT|nr:sigma-70 family RNA polymerase sigma factor [Inquilinus limosus]KGM35672.1 RNA polymerase sigma factor [Inquilinus limosus MP06]